jgi:hypothetical protein
VIGAFRLYCAEQNYELDQILFGEAFLYNGFICYWNSRHLSVCAVHIYDPRAKLILTDLLAEFKSSAKSIKVFGYENQIDSSSLEAFGQTHVYYNSTNDSSEFVMDSMWGFEIAERTRRRMVASSRSVEIKEFDYLSIEDLDLFRLSVPKSMVRMDQIFWWCLPRLQGCKGVFIARCFQERKLIGAAIVQVVNNQQDSCLLMVTTDPKYRHVGDCLYMAVRDRFCAEGKKVLVGHAETDGLRQFKKKWGRPGVVGKIVGVAALPRQDGDKISEWLQHMGVWWVETAILQNAGRNPFHGI